MMKIGKKNNGQEKFNVNKGGKYRYKSKRKPKESAKIVDSRASED